MLPHNVLHGWVGVASQCIAWVGAALQCVRLMETVVVCHVSGEVCPTSSCVCFTFLTWTVFMLMDFYMCDMCML